MAKKKQKQNKSETTEIESAEKKAEITESVPAGAQNETIPSDSGSQEEAVEAPSDENQDLSPDDLLDDVRRSLIEEEVDQSQKESQKDSKWWRRKGRKAKSAEPEKLSENVEISLPIMLERTDLVEEPAQKPEPEEQLDEIDDLIDMLQADSEETAVET